MRGVTAHLHHCTGVPELPDQAERLAALCQAMAENAP